MLCKIRQHMKCDVCFWCVNAKIHVLCNCAHIYVMHARALLTKEDWNWAIELNWLVLLTFRNSWPWTCVYFLLPTSSWLPLFRGTETWVATLCLLANSRSLFDKSPWTGLHKLLLFHAHTHTLFLLLQGTAHIFSLYFSFHRHTCICVFSLLLFLKGFYHWFPTQYDADKS